MGWAFMTCTVLHENCNLELSKDKSLPSNSYLVTYQSEDKIRYDIVTCTKRVDIFDTYWDKYRENLKDIRWTEGRVNPRIWGYKAKEIKKKK